MAGKQRHSWSPPYRTQYRTERVCMNCGMVKVTRHEPGALPWQEFIHKGRRVESGGGTPECAGGR